MGLIAAATAEVADLHAFFVAWLGRAGGDLDFARCADVLAPGFVLVGPDGCSHGRDELVSQLRSARGSRPGLSIWTRDLRAREVAPGLVLVGYEEWQREGEGPERGRVSSALLAPADSAPRGVLWLHVHETWLPA